MIQMDQLGASQSEGRDFFFTLFIISGVTNINTITIFVLLTRPDTRLPQSRVGGQGP